MKSIFVEEYSIMLFYNHSNSKDYFYFILIPIFYGGPTLTLLLCIIVFKRPIDSEVSLIDLYSFSLARYYSINRLHCLRIMLKHFSISKLNTVGSVMYCMIYGEYSAYALPVLSMHVTSLPIILLPLPSVAI